MDGFKADFVQYLRENNLLEKTDLDKKDSKIKISQYSNELKGFLKSYKTNEKDLIEASIDINEILSMDFDNFGNIKTDKIDAQNEKQDTFGGLFGFLLNQDGIKEQVDANGDGKISADEIKEFAQTVASKDGDENDLSLSDLLNSYELINNNQFNLGDYSALNDVGNFFQGANTVASDVTQTSVPSFKPTISYNDLEELSDGDLNGKKADEQSNLANANENMKSALDGTNSNIVPTNDEVDSSYQAFLNEVQKIDSEENNFESRLTAKNSEIAQKQTQLNELTLTNESNGQKCTSLAAELSFANSDVASAQISLQNLAAQSTSKTDTNTTTNDLAAATDKLQLAINAQQSAQDEYDKAVEEYEKSTKDVEDCQAELDGLNNDLINLQNEIITTSAQNKDTLQSLANAWNQNRSDNQQSRKDVFVSYSEQANAAQSNIELIDRVQSNQ